MNTPAQYESSLRSADVSSARRDAKKGVAFVKHLFLPNLPQMEPRFPKIFMVMPKANFTFRIKQVARVFRKQMDPKKAPGYDLIIGKILKGLPRISITQRNSTSYLFPQNLEGFEITMIGNCGKDQTQVASYRRISLLPIILKVVEILLLSNIS